MTFNPDIQGSLGRQGDLPNQRQRLISTLCPQSQIKLQRLISKQNLTTIECNRLLTHTGLLQHQLRRQFW